MKSLALAGTLLLLASTAMPADKRADADTETIDKRAVRIHRSIERGVKDEPEADQEYFIHTFVLDLVGLRPSDPNRRASSPPVGTPLYQVVHTSEGPYVGQEAWQRRAEIMKEGLMIGTHFWPMDRIQRVELRPE
jgi:hypothetical protein